MTCRQFRNLLPELGDSETNVAPPEVVAHLRSCPSCPALLERHRTLRAGLRRLAAQQTGVTAPPKLEALLLDEFRAKAESLRRASVLPRPRPASSFWPLPAGILSAGALAAALAAFLLWNHPPGTRGTLSPEATISAAAEDAASLDADFIPLPYSYYGNGSLLAETAAGADVVRVEMPRSTLIALGVPVPEGGDSEPVRAELLLGAGGMPQAVRLLE